MRISASYLLNAGWHGIYTNSKQFWSHPEYCPFLVRFKEAARITKMMRQKDGE